MKNPFEKNDHKILIAGIAIGAVAVGAAAYLLLTDTGAGVREQLTTQFYRLRDNLLGKEAEDQQPADPQAYLHHKPKAPKTDREQLLHHEIIHEPEHHEGLES